MNQTPLPDLNLAISVEIEGFLGDKESLLTNLEFRQLLDILLPQELVEFINQNYQFKFIQGVMDKEGSCNIRNKKALIEIYPKIFYLQGNLDFNKFFFAVGHLIGHGIKKPAPWDPISLVNLMSAITPHTWKAAKEIKEKENWADILSFNFLNPLFMRNFGPEPAQACLDVLDNINNLKGDTAPSIDPELSPQLIEIRPTAGVKIPKIFRFSNYALEEWAWKVLKRLRFNKII